MRYTIFMAVSLLVSKIVKVMVSKSCAEVKIRSICTLEQHYRPISNDQRSTASNLRRDGAIYIYNEEKTIFVQC